MWNVGLDESQAWIKIDWEGSGRGVQNRGHIYTNGLFMSMYGKNHYNIVN